MTHLELYDLRRQILAEMPDLHILVWPDRLYVRFLDHKSGYQPVLRDSRRWFIYELEDWERFKAGKLEPARLLPTRS